MHFKTQLVKERAIIVVVVKSCLFPLFFACLFPIFDCKLNFTSRCAKDASTGFEKKHSSRNCSLLNLFDSRTLPFFSSRISLMPVVWLSNLEWQGVEKVSVARWYVFAKRKIYLFSIQFVDMLSYCKIRSLHSNYFVRDGEQRADLTTSQRHNSHA